MPENMSVLPLRFESQPLPPGKLLEAFVCSALGAIVAGVLMVISADKTPDTIYLICLSLAMLIYGVVEVRSLQTRTIISIADKQLVVQTGSMVTVSFSLDEIAQFDSCAPLPNNYLPSHVQAAKVVTRSGLIFYLPTDRLAIKDKRQLIDLLSSHALASRDVPTNTVHHNT